MIELIYFALVCVIFLLAYGVAIQSLLYPNTEENWSQIIYKILYNPYLSLVGDFAFHRDELEGTRYMYRLTYFLAGIKARYWGIWPPTGAVPSIRCRRLQRTHTHSAVHSSVIIPVLWATAQHANCD